MSPDRPAGPKSRGRCLHTGEPIHRRRQSARRRGAPRGVVPNCVSDSLLVCPNWRPTRMARATKSSPGSSVPRMACRKCSPPTNAYQPVGVLRCWLSERRSMSWRLARGRMSIIPAHTSGFASGVKHTVAAALPGVGETTRSVCLPDHLRPDGHAVAGVATPEPELAQPTVFRGPRVGNLETVGQHPAKPEDQAGTIQGRNDHPEAISCLSQASSSTTCAGRTRASRRRSLRPRLLRDGQRATAAPGGCARGCRAVYPGPSGGERAGDRAGVVAAGVRREHAPGRCRGCG